MTLTTEIVEFLGREFLQMGRRRLKDALNSIKGMRVRSLVAMFARDAGLKRIERGLPISNRVSAVAAKTITYLLESEWSSYRFTEVAGNNSLITNGQIDPVAFRIVTDEALKILPVLL
jgi:hypothetical protein